MNNNWRYLLINVVVLFLGFGLQTNTNAAEISQSDPLEGINRVVFTFNDHLDRAILKPVATFYNTIMPKPLNQGVHNFFNNINNLPIIADDILQANLRQTLSDSWRFAINTTVGIGGLFDVAGRMNLPQNTNDFGLTMARWGYVNSTYVVWPFFGPSTIRDGIGIPVDYFAFSVYPRIRNDVTRYEVYGVSVVDRRASLLQYQSVMEEVAIDKYTFMRNAYLQNRAYLIEKSKKPSGETQSTTMLPLDDDSSDTTITGNAKPDDTLKPATITPADIQPNTKSVDPLKTASLKPSATLLASTKTALEIH